MIIEFQFWRLISLLLSFFGCVAGFVKFIYGQSEKRREADLERFQAEIRAVRAAYVFEAAPLDVAAARHSIPEATARRWKTEARKAGDDWDKARAAQFMAGGGIEDVVRQTLSVVVRQVQATVEAIQDDPDMPPGDQVQNLASLADAYNKLIAASRRVMPETDRLAVAMDVLKRFAEYVSTQKPALAAEFIDLIEPFGEALEKEYR